MAAPGRQHHLGARDQPGRAATNQATCIHYQGSAEDVTALKQVQEAERLSRSRYEALFLNSPDIVALTDLDGVVEDINYVSSGYEKTERVGSDFAEYLDEDQKRGFPAGGLSGPGNRPQAATR